MIKVKIAENHPICFFFKSPNGKKPKKKIKKKNDELVGRKMLSNIM